jgi:hypothetical protein
VNACAIALALSCLSAAAVPALAQPCLHGPDSGPEQRARRAQAVGAARAVNNMEANQPGARVGHYLRHEELAVSPFAQKQTNEAFKALNLTPGEDIVPGWQLTLDVTEDGYWFMIEDKTDPCGFSLISNTSGLIYTAEPLR